MTELFANPTEQFARLPEKIQARISRQSPIATACWLWLGPLHYHGRAGDGYGRQNWPEDVHDMTSKKRNWLAHRLTYTLLVGPIPQGLVLDHVKKRGCEHRHCVRPDHCEPVTMTTNTMRGDAYKSWFTPKEPEEIPF